MNDKEFTARTNCVVIGFLVGVFSMLGLIKLGIPTDPAYYLEKYNNAVLEEQDRHKAEQLRHNIALHGDKQ